MVKKIAFLFPGQGSQSVGMGNDLYESYDAAKKVYDIADKTLNKSISDICFNGPDDILKQTINTQPAIVTTSIAALEAFKHELDIVPDYTAGHSLGEYCAMYTAGVMNLETTLKLIQKRAELMAQAKGGSMAAILNSPEGILEAGLEEGRKVGYVDVANYNSPVQTVITGDSEAVAKAGEYMLSNGARKVVPLAVSGAFHSEFMFEAGNEYADYVKNFVLSDALIPVITNTDAELTTKAEEFAVKMPKQIYSSVLWTHTIQKMIVEGVDTFVEIGPGKILAGLNKKIAPDANVYNIYDKISLENTVNILKEQMAGV